MYFRPFLLLGAAVALSGCFGSNEALWPTRSGEELSLSPGEYRCVMYDNGVPSVNMYEVTALIDGVDFYYHATSLVEKPTNLSFHKIVDDLYLVAISFDKEGYNIFSYARVAESRVVFLKPNKDQMQEYAKKYGVTLGNGVTLDGPESPATKRAFIVTLGKHLTDSSVVTDCSLASE